MYKRQVYFITICSKNKRCTFGTIVGGGVPDAPRTRLSPTGKIVARQLGNMIAFYPHVRIEKYVVMPNHIHLLIAIQEGPSGASRTPPPTGALIDGAEDAILGDYLHSVYRINAAVPCKKRGNAVRYMYWKIPYF